MRTLTAVAATALLISLTASRATPQRPLQFGTSADLVLIDLIATDGDGRRVTDLRADEMEVYEDGKRRPVEVLRFVGAAAFDAAPASPAIPMAKGEPAPASPGASTSPTSSSRLVIAIDQGAMPSELFVPVRAAILKMVRENLDPEKRLRKSGVRLCCGESQIGLPITVLRAQGGPPRMRSRPDQVCNSSPARRSTS